MSKAIEQFPRHDSEVVEYVELSEDEALTEEQLAEEAYENERIGGVIKLCVDKKFDLATVEDISKMGDENEVLGFLYQWLLEEGEDPDEVLKEYGIIECIKEV